VRALFPENKVHFARAEQLWSYLPGAVRHADSLHSFKRRLKSHFFTLCFND